MPERGKTRKGCAQNKLKHPVKRRSKHEPTYVY